MKPSDVAPGIVHGGTKYVTAETYDEIFRRYLKARTGFWDLWPIFAFGVVLGLFAGILIGAAW